MQEQISNPDFPPLHEEDGPEVIRIFNHYIVNSNATFLDEPVSENFYHRMREMLGSFPSAVVRDNDGAIIGFGMVRPHNPLPAFKHTGEISYFISPGHTGKNIGGKLLAYLEQKARESGMTCILAQISSKNDGSIRFHHKNGFVECGRFVNAGKKNGLFFDTIWMQKFV